MCGSTTQTTSTSPPASVLANYNDVYNQAKSVASTPYQPYSGELTAGLNQGQQDAIGELQGGVGIANPYINAGSGYLNNAASGLGNVSNYLQAGSQSTAQGQNFQNQAASYGGANAYQQFMSPYTQNVINTTMAQANQNDAIQQQQLNSGAIGKGAYGGDRAGVAGAALAGQQALANNSTVANLYNQGYSNAQQSALSNASLYGNLANSANQSAGLYNSLGQTQAGVGTAYGQLGATSGNLGQTAQNANTAGASAALQGSTLQQQTQQAADTANYGQFQNSIQYPFQSTSFLSNIAQGIGSNSGSLTTSPGPSTLSQAAGVATSGLGILGATGAFGSSGWLTSDERAKEDVAPIGKTFDGQTFYRFRYKGDPTVRTGLMAQEVEKRTPEAVGETSGGLKAVEYGTATDRAAERGHFARGGRLGFADGGIGVSGNGLDYSANGLTAGGLLGGVSAVQPVQPQVHAPAPLALVGANPVIPSQPTPDPSSSGGNGVLSGGLGGDNKNLWLGVTAAGLGMLGGSSPFAGVNIGQGGLAGLKEFTGLQQQDRQNALQQQEVGFKGQEIGLEKQKEDFAERRAMMLLQAAQDASHAMAGGTGAAVGIPQGTVAGTPAGTIPSDAPSAVPLTGAVPSGVAPTPDFWSNVQPDYNPNVLNGKAQSFERAAQMAIAGGNEAMGNQLLTQASNFRKQAENINQRGTVLTSDGKTVSIPGFDATMAAKAAAVTNATEATKSKYDMVEIQPTPGGPTQFVPKSQVLNIQNANPDATVLAPGIGSPPGAAIAKQPASFAEKQKKMADDEEAMQTAFQARQVSRQRLQALGNMLSTFQTGAAADDKANAIALVRAAGIDVPDTATANPAAYQQFVKNATANVFSDMKAQGGKVLVSEIEGLTKANANPELQPAANASVIAQGLGISNREDQHYRDYTAWKDKNPYAVTAAPFEIDWADKNPTQKYVDEAHKDIAPLGVDIPSKDKLVDGQAYMTKNGKGYWDARSQTFKDKL